LQFVNLDGMGVCYVLRWAN
jgi:hypothetical protein